MRTKGSDLKKAVFVPLTDDILYEHPERVLGPVIPFSQSARPAAVESTPFIPVRSDLNVETGLKTSAAAVMKRFKAG